MQNLFNIHTEHLNPISGPKRVLSTSICRTSQHQAQNNTLKMGQTWLKPELLCPLGHGAWVSVFNHNTPAFETESREFGAEEFTRGSWKTRKQREMSMGNQAKYKNQCSTLILQEALRALSLPLSYMLWFSLPKATEEPLCLAINSSTTGQKAGQRPWVRTFRLALQCRPGPWRLPQKQRGKEWGHKTLISICSRHLPGLKWYKQF